MRHNEQELEQLKDELNQMWKLVTSQLERSKHAFLKNDIEVALEVSSAEKRVNAFELKVESSCENYIALYNPVAIDLRLILSIMKISITLERIGDYAEGIARHVIDGDCGHFDKTIVESLEMEKMFDILINMMADSYVALNAESSKSFGKILAKDKGVNEIYHSSIPKIEEFLTKNPKEIRCGLKLMLLIRKMERVGDHCKNIVEEIVFYVDAKVLKHKGKVK
ncbi:MAG: phosphate signaling complex protein PhoU [Brumimicrobium sp.]